MCGLIAVIDEISVVPDERRVFDPLRNDEGEGSLSIISLTQPSLGNVLTDGELIYYDSPAGFDGNQSFTYTIQDSAGQTTTGTVNLSLPSAPPAGGEKWDFNETAGTQLESTSSTSGATFTGVTSSQVATNGSGQLIIGSDTKNHSRVTTDVLATPRTTGRITLEFLVSSIDLSGGSSSGASLGFGFRDSTSNTDFGAVRIRENGNNLILDVRTTTNHQIYDFGAGGSVTTLAGILVRSTLDLDAGQIETVLSIGSGAEQSLAPVPVNPAATSFSAFKFSGNTLSTNWGAGDTAAVDYFCYNLDESTLSLYESWACTIPWNGLTHTGELDNPDGDSYPNLLEFALGLDPLVADCTNIFPYTSFSPTPQISFTPLRDPSLLNYRIQFSTDLSSWPAAWEHLVSSPAGVSVLPAMPAGDKVFFRLAVDEP